jgi:hypothetical protein
MHQQGISDFSEMPFDFIVKACAPSIVREFIFDEFLFELSAKGIGKIYHDGAGVYLVSSVIIEVGAHQMKSIDLCVEDVCYRNAQSSQSF